MRPDSLPWRGRAGEGDVSSRQEAFAKPPAGAYLPRHGI